MGIFRFLTLLGATAFSAGAAAQITPGPGYAIKRLDGDNDLGAHFALSRATGNQRNGFFYLADRRALYGASCSGAVCTISSALTNTGDRGQFVSAAALPGVSNRPLVAYYDATNQDLRSGICSTSSGCGFLLADRILDSGGDVGQHTAMAINPATGFAAISYYAATAGISDARIYVCSNADCSAGSANTIEMSGDVGRNSAIAFGANVGNFTNVFAVYDNLSTGQVRFARAVLPFNSFGAADLGAGSDAAINVGTSGLPDIVYRSADDSLKYTRCLSFDCAGANQVTQTLAPIGRGFAPSITRLANGNVFITAQESSTGTLFGYVCNDASCSAPQVLTMEAGPNMGGVSIASSYDDSRPLAFYQDVAAKDVRASECTQLNCTTLQQRVATNGLSVSLPSVALRSDGRAVAIWLKQRAPVIGVCADLACSSVDERQTSGGNSDIRPTIAIRPDGRPFAYYSAFGGTAAWDCSDANCTSGTERFVSGTGSSTSIVAELALRSDGIPVMLYYNNSTNGVFAYICADLNCSTGTARLLFTEPTLNTFLSAFALSVGADNRPIVSYQRVNTNVSLVQRRMLRCVDAACTSASAIDLASSVQFASTTPMALQSNGAPNFVEIQSFPNQNLVRCADQDCSSFTSTLLPFGADEQSSTMRFKPGNLALFDAASSLLGGGYRECADSSCTSAAFRPVISSNPQANANFIGRLALNPTNQAVVIFDETRQQDIWLTLPISEVLFRNGFEAAN